MSHESTVKPANDEIKLKAEYESAFEEWHNTEDAALWDGAVDDGLTP